MAFQTVHHDLWDYDLPAPPTLVSYQKGGKTIDAVTQTTKHGFVFVLDRETGKSLYPIEERKVPASNIPGEKAWPTQPFPLAPKAFVKQIMTEEDLNHFSDADHKAILEQFRAVRYEGLFTPPDLKGTLSLPATRGGANWGGSAYDPSTSILYIREIIYLKFRPLWTQISILRREIILYTNLEESNILNIVDHVMAKS